MLKGKEADVGCCLTKRGLDLSIPLVQQRGQASLYDAFYPELAKSFEAEVSSAIISLATNPPTNLICMVNLRSADQ